MSEEQWISRSWTQFSVSCSLHWWSSAGLWLRIRCILSKSPWPLLQPSIANCEILRFYCRVIICIAVDCEQMQTVGSAVAEEAARSASQLGMHSIRIPFRLRSLGFESLKSLNMFFCFTSLRLILRLKLGTSET